MKYIKNGTLIGDTHKGQIAYSNDGTTWKYFSKSKIKDIDGNGVSVVKLRFDDKTFTIVDLTKIINQPTWTTGNVTGFNAAINDISSWINEISAGGSGSGSVDMSGVTSGLSTLDTDLQSVETALSTIEGAMSTIETNQGSSQTTLTAIKTTLTSMQTVLSGIQSLLGNIQSIDSGLQNTLSDIEGVENGIGTTLSTIQGIQSSMETTMTSIQTVLNTVSSTETSSNTLLGNIKTILNTSQGLLSDLKKYLNGSKGFTIVVPSMGAVSGNWYLIRTIDDSMFTMLNDAGVNLAGLPSLSGMIVPLGTNLTTTDLDGNGFLAIQLTSGKVIAYIK